MATAMKSHKLRPYQRTAIESARRALTKSGSCILQIPTGAGKTRAATEIVATSRGVIWFVCHRQEIERQVAKAFTAAGIDFGIVSPRGELQPDKRVQIVSVHTLRKRIGDLPEPRLVIWDECHHVAAKSWAAIRAKLKGARHLGLTATPERLDGKGLGEWFAELVTGPGINELIKRGYLSEFRYFAPSDPDLTNAKLQAGDYKKADLGRVMNTPVLIGDAVREYKKHAKGKRALTFCASVEASQALAARFNKDGIKAAHVDGATPAKERDSAIEDLAAGRIKVLCNVEVFTEGFDLPAIDAVILMRPTKSPTLLLQMIGRGLRKAKGKDEAIILDHAGLRADHGDFAGDWPWSLQGGAAKARRAAVVRGPRRCPECKEVRFERVETCRCGFEFPTGREVGEYDGVLTEVRGVVPDGCCTVAEFSRIYRVTHGAITQWRARGMPTYGAFIPKSSAQEWVSGNVNLNEMRSRSVGAASARRGAPEGHSTLAEFAARHSVNKTTVRRWIERGMPSDTTGVFVHTTKAERWVSRNIDRSSIVAMRAPDHGTERITAFAKRFGVGHNVVARWIKRGMPADKFGKVIVAPAIKWVADGNGNSNNLIVGGVKDVNAYVTQVEFAKMRGFKSVTPVINMIRLGMPSSNSKPHLVDALKWCGKNASRFKAVPPLDQESWWEFESGRAFTARVGVTQGMMSYWKPRGLPCASNGWVHIQRGLEWVRDNTDIKIPASAWPKPKKATRKMVKHESRVAA